MKEKPQTVSETSQIATQGEQGWAKPAGVLAPRPLYKGASGVRTRSALVPEAVNHEEGAPDSFSSRGAELSFLSGKETRN